jgi:solute carrier family 25 phosphate transporter 23/24/25/41
MQVSGLKTLGHGYDNAFDAIRVMYKSEGALAFYRGLWPNLLKVAPSIATSFYVYESMKGFLQSQ